MVANKVHFIISCNLLNFSVPSPREEILYNVDGQPLGLRYVEEAENCRQETNGGEEVEHGPQANSGDQRVEDKQHHETTDEAPLHGNHRCDTLYLKFEEIDELE